MCFKCGAVEHPGVSCGSVGNAELREYMNSNDVVKCPHCGFATEKDGGCNSMTCAKCNSSWCWICAGKIRGDSHFETWNIFGCPGAQFSDDSSCLEFVKKFFLLVFIPSILLLGPIVGLISLSYRKWHYRNRCKSCTFFSVFFLV